MTDRPFAAQARQLCPETDEHHDRVWFCLKCRALESRLTPISEVLKGVLADADLTIANPFAFGGSGHNNGDQP